MRYPYKDEFDEEMIEALQNDLLNIAQEMGDEERFDVVSTLLRAIRYVRKMNFCPQCGTELEA